MNEEEVYNLMSGKESLIKGAYKPPRYRCFFTVDGVPGQRAYRSLRAVNKLKQTSGVQNFAVITLQ